MAYKKKLIEVALPLEAINKESAREKSIRHGHPSTLHLWWARRPLATCRAVLFASLVDDPSARPEEFPTEEAQESERQRLFRLIEQLVKWENLNDDCIFNAAHNEIMKSTGGNPPSVYDPFCGGGSIPLEAQRLGLEAHGSDLNPVAVMITKALIEIPPKFAGNPPVNPEARKKFGGSVGWKGAAGLAEDIRYYGQWMRNEAEQRIGHLYPKVKLPPERGGGEATVIAWLWARTVKCPNPACNSEIPLVTSFILSSKKGKEAYLHLHYEGKKPVIKISNSPPPNCDTPKKGLKRGMSGIFECPRCKNITTRNYVAEQGKLKQFGLVPLAIVAEGKSGRVYLPTNENVYPMINLENIDLSGLNAELSPNPRDVWCRNFGLEAPQDLFTPRQLVALTTFSDLVGEARENVLQDALSARLLNDGHRLNDGGKGAVAYADAVATYLGFAVDKGADYWSVICSWHSGRDTIRNTFGRQAIPMTWDFAEANPLSDSTGNFFGAVEWILSVVKNSPCCRNGFARQADATKQAHSPANRSLISSDPPYYDNIGYADLSDFFYVWLRRSIGNIYPDIFSTMMVPKTPELVALQYRFDGNKAKAQQYFETGLGQAFAAIHQQVAPEYPVTIYYAFKQAETESAEDSGEDADSAKMKTVTSSTGWETMLTGLLKAGFAITGTWPMRSELSNRMVASGTNALASSIVLVCRQRLEDAPTVTRKEFLSALRRELPQALKELRQGNIAPVDLAQATVGPGMSVYSQYKAVLEANGRTMPVRTALQIINQELDAWLTAQEGAMDQETRFCVAWYEQFGLSEAVFGEADVLARAKNTAVQRLADLGLLLASKGKVRLLTREELPTNWIPAAKSPVWLCTQHLVRALAIGGEVATAKLAAGFDGTMTDAVKSLAYRLFSIADRKKWSDEALAYNALVASWSDVQAQAAELTGRIRSQGELF